MAGHFEVYGNSKVLKTELLNYMSTWETPGAAKYPFLNSGVKLLQRFAI